LLLSGLLNLVYFWRVIDQMYFVKHKGTENAVEVKEKGKPMPLSMVAPIMILAALCIIMGIVWLTDIPMPLINHILSNLRMGVTI